jgi:hypothetical protein
MLLAKQAIASAISRCSENVVAAACDDVRRSVSIFAQRNRSGRDALFTARRCANLFASASRQTKDFAYSHSKTKNVQP